MLSWDDAALLGEAGWEFGSHGVSHPRLPRLSRMQVVDELMQSRERMLRELGRAPTSLSYPYGAFAAVSGYRCAVTTRARTGVPEVPPAFRLARMSMGGSGLRLAKRELLLRLAMTASTLVRSRVASLEA